MSRFTRFRFNRFHFSASTPNDFAGDGETHRSIGVQAIIDQNQSLAAKVFPPLF